MSWEFVKLKKVLKQYRVTHIVENEREYKQVTISKHDGVKFRGTKKGKDIGRKRQFIIDLKQHPNTLMLVRQGVYEGAIGIAPPEVNECIATENMPMFSIEGINIDYLNLIIQSPYFKEELEKIPTTGSAQKSIHERQILEIEIPFPSQEEQELIVDSFKKNQNGLNEISTELTHQLDLVKQLRQAFLREAMQGKLVPQDPNDEPASVLLEKIKAEKERLIKEKKIKKQKPLAPINEGEIPFEIPKNWVWCRLGEIIDFFNGKAHEQGVSEFGEFILVTSKFVSTDGKKYRRVKARLTPLTTNDIAFVMSDVPNGIALARTYHVENDKSYTLNQRIGGLRPINGVYPRWLSYVVDRNQYFLDIDDGKKQTNLRKDQILTCPICLPPLSEQQRIVAKLDELMAYCDELEASIKESQQQNELLLQQVLREALEPKEK